MSKNPQWIPELSPVTDYMGALVEDLDELVGIIIGREFDLSTGNLEADDVYEAMLQNASYARGDHD